MRDMSLPPGLCALRLNDLPWEGSPALFLDRDGVLVEEVNYLHRIEDVAIIPGVPEAIADVNRAGLPVVMVTNQAGIGRGYYDWDEFAAVQQHVLELCAERGAHYDMILACAYHAEGIGDLKVEDHPWRKPGPGMLLEAERVLGIDLGRSFIIGDTVSDLTAGAAAGLPGGTLVMTGHGSCEWAEKGQQSFASLRARKAFEPQVAGDAGTAIRDWLKAQLPHLEHAS